MIETWRFIVFVAMLVAFGAMLPLVAEAAGLLDVLRAFV